MNKKDIAEMNLYKVSVTAEPVDVIDKPQKMVLHVGFRTQSGEAPLKTAIRMATTIAKDEVYGSNSYEIKITAISEVGRLFVWEMT